MMHHTCTSLLPKIIIIIIKDLVINQFKPPLQPYRWDSAHESWVTSSALQRAEARIRPTKWGEGRGKLNKRRRNYVPWKNTATIARMAASAASFEMGFVVRMNCVPFWAFLTDPLLVVAVLPPKMFLNPHEIAERVARVVVQAARLRAYEHPLFGDRSFPLQQFPRHFVPAPVHLQILVPLETLVADLADVPVRFQQRFRRQRHHLRIWIWHQFFLSLMTKSRWDGVQLSTISTQPF